jgi:putative transposase
MYPNSQQIEILEKNLNFCSFLYNNAFEESISYYKHFGKTRSYSQQCAQLPEIKELYAEETKGLYSQTIQQVLKKRETAFKNFFRRVKTKSGKAGFPRYQSRDRSNSLIFPQAQMTKGHWGGVKLLENKKLQIFGIPGGVKVKWHRPFQGRCKQVSIKRQAGKFYLILSCDAVPLAPLASTGKSIAIDLGLTNFITTDDGKASLSFHHPKPYKTSKEKLAYAQRKLSAKQKGSNNRIKAKKQVAKVSEHIANIRKDFQHKLALKLIRENDEIILEDLNVKSMLEGAQRAPGFEVSKLNIADASWGSFVQILSDKAEKAGRKITKVNPKDTSKTCSRCLKVKESLKLSDRTFDCEACGFEMDRDQNAALNIRRLGMSPAIAQKQFQKSLALC